MTCLTLGTKPAFPAPRLLTAQACTGGAARILGARYAIGFPRVIERVEQDHCTLFVIVDGQAEALRCLAAAESVVGDLDRASTGVFAAWDLTLTKGVARWGALESGDEQ